MAEDPRRQKLDEFVRLHFGMPLRSTRKPISAEDENGTRPRTTMGVQAIREIQQTTQAPRCFETSAGQSLVRSGRHSGRPG